MIADEAGAPYPGCVNERAASVAGSLGYHGMTPGHDDQPAPPPTARRIALGGVGNTVIGAAILVTKMPAWQHDGAS